MPPPCRHRPAGRPQAASCLRAAHRRDRSAAFLIVGWREWATDLPGLRGTIENRPRKDQAMTMSASECRFRLTALMRDADTEVAIAVDHLAIRASEKR